MRHERTRTTETDHAMNRLKWTAQELNRIRADIMCEINLDHYGSREIDDKFVNIVQKLMSAENLACDLYKKLKRNDCIDETEVSEREPEPAVDWANVARPS